MRKLLISIALTFALTALAVPQGKLTGGAKLSGGTKISASGGGGSSTLNTSLVGYWKFDESSGDAADSSGAGLTLTNNNTATFGAGKVGNAAYLASASSQFFSRASSAALQFGGSKDWSIAGWVYITDNSLDQMAVGKDTDTSGRREFSLYLNGSTNKFYAEHFIATDNAANLVANTFGVTSNATYYFISVTHTDTTNVLTISVNAGTRDTTTVTLQAPSDAGFYIGARQYPGLPTYWNGRLDEWGKWDKALTTTEEACLYNSGNGTTPPFTGLCT